MVERRSKGAEAMRTLTTRASPAALRSLAVVALGAVLLSAGGCENGCQGALSGAGIGALAGMGLGSLSGNMGKGAAAGAILGAVSGAVLGDQNRRMSSWRGY